MDNNDFNGDSVEDADEGVNNVRITSNKADYPASRLAGLNRWLPGESGNPNGRPKGALDSPRACLDRLVAKNASMEEIKEFGLEVAAGDHPLKADVLAHILWLQVKKGDMIAIREVFDQLELPHPKNVNLTADFNVSIPSQFADAF